MLEKNTLKIEQDKIEAEVGPLKYVAELIYGKDAKDHFDEAVRIVIIVLVFVFDPLAVLLLISANISLTQLNEKRLLTKKQKEVKIESELDKRKKDIKYKDKTIKDLRKKERDYKNFVKKLGAKELSDLDPDEIKVKLDQILDWNDNSNKPKKYVEVNNDRFNRTKNK